MARPPVLPVVLAQHAEDAAVLWNSRAWAVGAPHLTLAGLARLEGRLEAHLDGLRVAGAGAWPLLLEPLERGDPGEFFAATVLAVESGETAKLEVVFERIARPAQARGAAAALAWASWTDAENVVRWLLDADAPLRRRIGIAACALARRFPGPYLAAACAAEEPALRARALRAAGELGRRELAGALQAALADDEDESCRRAAAVALALLGDAGAVEPLRGIAEAGDETVLELLLRAAGHEAAHALLKAWATDPARRRHVIRGAGIVGDPVYVPWLIEQMSVPALARVAGEALTLITGVDLAAEGLDRAAPDEVQGGPNDDPADETVALDADEALPWPDPARVAAWWRGAAGSFTAGTRCLLGRPLAPEALLATLRTGRQRQRRAAALELMLLRRTVFLFETRAAARAQLQLLAQAR